MTKIVNQDKARQGRWGSPVLVVLVVALVLAMIVWYGAEWYGAEIETPRTENTQTIPAE